MVETKDVAKRIHVSLSGNVVKHVIEMRHKKERERGLVQSIASIVYEAIDEKYTREIQNGNASDGKEMANFF